MGNAHVFGLDAANIESGALCPGCVRQNACDLVPHVPSGTPLFALALKRRRGLQRGEALFRQHDPFSAVYLLSKGCLKTERVTPEGLLVVTGFRFPGDLVGLESLSGTKHLASGVALDTSEVCEFDLERLLSVGSGEPRLLRWIVHRLGQGLQEKEAALYWVTRRKCCDRLGGPRLDLPSGTGRAYPDPAVSTHRGRASAERWIAPPTGTCTNAVPEGAPKNGTIGRRVRYALTARAEG